MGVPTFGGSAVTYSRPSLCRNAEKSYISMGKVRSLIFLCGTIPTKQSPTNLIAPKTFFRSTELPTASRGLFPASDFSGLWIHTPSK